MITGSFNFTKAAEERNAENLLIIHDPGHRGGVRGQLAASTLLHSTTLRAQAAGSGRGDARPAAGKKSKAGTRKAND